MAEMTKNQPSHWWWLDSHTTTKRSPWLQSTLSELNEKTTAMLKLIEEDADSFAKRAEMYYKKRPELVRMVEDFYRSHRSLAERYDQVKPDTYSGGSPFASAKYQFEKLTTFSDNGFDTYSHSEHCDAYESEESEVDDPEHEEEEGTKDQIKQKDTICDEVMMLREEMERLRDENEAQKEQLKQKDEEKIEVIRQLSLAIDVLKQENVKMKNFIAKESFKKWKNPFEINKIVGAFSMKLFNGTSKNQPSVELSRCGASDGKKANTVPGVPKRSGLGGLGLEGIVVHFLSRDMMYYASLMLKYLSLSTVEKLLVFVSRIVYGDLSDYGIPFPTEGPFTMKMKYGKFPIIDLGTVKKIKSGEIQVLPAEIECIGGDDLLNEDGFPKPSYPNHWKGQNGLYCVGLSRRGFFGANMDAQNVANDIVSLIPQEEREGVGVM
uniref:NAB domain-containing protein n=1 Tax=Cajanus cajan TaxID=3821 RepID=A0A151TXD9_CAJCA|nr:hypothetical protein KK1_010891 [Cajanus cajan]